jgi:hypothetical protein
MKRRICGFHQDEEGQWVAELDCGHSQHVRHDPPWQVRPWVLSAESRNAWLGSLLECRRCGPAGEEEREQAYKDALMRGLCGDGAAEVVRGRFPKRDRLDS